MITGYGSIESKAIFVHVNRTTGTLTLDSLRLNLDRPDWPHGATGRAIPHGAVFSK